MLKHYPSMNDYISSNGGIVHSPDFEIAIVKVIEDEVNSLDSTQKELLKPFRQENHASAGVGISPVKPDTPYALQALKKKWVPCICFALISKSRKSLYDQSGVLTILLQYYWSQNNNTII